MNGLFTYLYNEGVSKWELSELRAKPKLPLTSILTLLHLLPANNVALTML